METLALGLFCLAPLLLFAAGWISCYVLVVRYRLRFERRPDFDPPASATSKSRAGQAPAWEP